MFSVIMPLYNKEPYVARAIGSVLGQTCQNWELVVVDDCSTDRSATVVEGFDDPRIRFVGLESNVGAAAARNHGVALSRGQWLTFLDADDWWEPTFLDEMAGLVERYPTAGIYGSGYFISKNSRRHVAPVGVESGFEEGQVDYCKIYAKTLCMPLCTGAVCLSRQVFDSAGGFAEGIALGEDFLLWLPIALSHSVVLLNKPLSNYNQDSDPTFRGTARLHPPERHMLWQLRQYEPLEASNPSYKRLVDGLRLYGLLPYLVESRYREAARRELAKVDWASQPRHIRFLYRLPWWLLGLRQRLLRVGSNVKQAFVRCLSR
ncbi:MAG: glycosyltransferase family 2 protein [Bacteroidales bacterium]|nr:glycosyltransferase family 2 protein [Bacteroidales bacterium]